MYFNLFFPEIYICGYKSSSYEQHLMKIVTLNARTSTCKSRKKEIACK